MGRYDKFLKLDTPKEEPTIQGIIVDDDNKIVHKGPIRPLTEQEKKELGE
jgi:hypothetical protein